VKLGLGIDPNFRLSDDDQRSLAIEAAALGYTSLWTTGQPSAFGLCGLWYEASGLETGIAVIPVQEWRIERIITETRRMDALTGGRFALGVGSGRERAVPLRLMREAVATLRPNVGQTPIYLGALGSQMLRLAGELYDGAALNWCSATQIHWSRERVAAGALAARRGPSEVKIHQFVRVAVDSDHGTARQALGKMLLAYAMARSGETRSVAYRDHFARMGFRKTLDDLEQMRSRGSTDDDLAARLPDELMAQVGYWGGPQGAAAAVKSLSVGLDTTVVRVVPTSRNDAECLRVAMRSCAAAV
jgi:alkanesulfonate monooxygenase SsuD/methylene tetrahydromethanopterin reductase-like flavin-dependent oxidoreductase (luciferase family)